MAQEFTEQVLNAINISVTVSVSVMVIWWRSCQRSKYIDFVLKIIVLRIFLSQMLNVGLG